MATTDTPIPAEADSTPDARTGTRSLTLGVRLLGLMLLATLLHCRSLPSAPPSAQQPERIVRSSDGAELSFAQLLEILAATDVVYLGERHDEPRHHAIQLEVLAGLVERGMRPRLGFEAFELAHTPALQQYVAEAEEVEGEVAEQRLRERIGWGEARDATWSYYVELLRFARREALQVFGADLPHTLRARMGRVGFEGLNAVERSLLHSTGFEDADYAALVRGLIKESHCGYGPADYLDRMYRVWVERNDAMSLAVASMLAESPEAPVVLVLGTGHVLYDMGVYERVAHRRPGVKQANVGLRDAVEEEPEEGGDEEAAPPVPERFGPAHDYVWFARREREDIPDPCKAFRGR